ncbi:MAG: amidohydrolase [Saprospiraceae bacterium]|nr:amidohydrolase [Saprospiraceae bacterium]
MDRLIHIFLLWIILGPYTLTAQSPLSAEKQEVIQTLEDQKDTWSSTAQSIWTYAELGYQENKSSDLLMTHLQEAGFKVDRAVAGMPTAFVASYGQGHPVIGILAEFDALPGVSQAAVPYRKEREDCTSGHACGHHLFGTGSTAAAIAVKDWMAKNNIQGTIRLYGTPAEEGGAGKVYMVREGLFDDVDAVLHWHPGNSNNAGAASCLAIKSALFKFHGIAAHAAGAPWRGRSALDGVEAMNDMINLMREHVPDMTRIHYVITKGGEAPNVVPAYAEVNYYVRHPEMKVVHEIFERMVKAAEGAALGTGTTMEYEVTGGSYNLLPNAVLAQKMYDNLSEIGGVKYDDAELAFAREIIKSYPDTEVDLKSAAEVSPFVVTDRAFPFSTDVGDVSWIVPTTGLSTATWVPGTGAHSWQAVAAGGTTIGKKGMMVAAKTIACTAIDLFRNPEELVKAKVELKERQGKDFHYEALIGDGPPNLNYRGE